MSAQIIMFVLKPRAKGIMEGAPGFRFDDTYLPDPPLEEYIRSAGYPSEDDKTILPK